MATIKLLYIAVRMHCSSMLSLCGYVIYIACALPLFMLVLFQRRCKDAEEDELPDTRLVYGRLVTYASDGELAMAQLDLETSLTAQRGFDSHDNEDSCVKYNNSYNADVKSLVVGGSWDICQVRVSKSSNKVVHFLAFVYMHSEQEGQGEGQKEGHGQGKGKMK